MLTDRELASLLILVACATFFLTKRDIRKSGVDVLRALFVPKIAVPLMLYLAYACLVVAVAWRIGIWTADLLKDTVIVVLTVAIPLLFGVTNVESGRGLTKKAMREVLGVGAIVALYVNLASLNILGELVVQVMVIFASMVSVVARHQGGEALRVAKIMDWILAAIGLAMLAFTTQWLLNNWKSLDLLAVGLTAAMSIWLPLLMLPFIYVLAFYAFVELVYVRLPFFNLNRRPPMRVRLAVFFGLRGSVFLARRFVGNWLAEVACVHSYKDAALVMARFRKNSRGASA